MRPFSLIAKMLILPLLVGVVTQARAKKYDYKPPRSNSTVFKSKKLVQYWTLDTAKVFRANIHLNGLTLLQFPSRVKNVIVGNTREIKTETYDNYVEVKPLLGLTHSSIHVHLYSREIVVIEVRTVKHGGRNEKIVFLEQNHNPMRDLALELNQQFNNKLKIAQDQLKTELKQVLPEEAVKDLVVHRIKGSRQGVSAKYRAFVITLESMVSTKRFTYFVLKTNATPDPNCPVSFVKKIEVKQKKRKKFAIEMEEFLNTGDRIVLRSPQIVSAPEKMKVYIFLNLSGKEKVLKARVI